MSVRSHVRDTTLRVAHHLAIELVCATNIHWIVAVAYIAPVHNEVRRRVHIALDATIHSISIVRSDRILVLELPDQLLQVLILHHRSVNIVGVERSQLILASIASHLISTHD